jgi:hypothetical protein
MSDAIIAGMSRCHIDARLADALDAVLDATAALIQ